MTTVDRRTVLAAGLVCGVAGATGALLAKDALDGYGPPNSAPNSASPSGSGRGTPLARVADVPRGGGVVLADQRVVLTRSSDDVVAAFSAVCTDQGCLVESVSDGAINCPCHGSRFDATTGEVLAGPARQALARVPLALQGDTIVTA